MQGLWNRLRKKRPSQQAIFMQQTRQCMTLSTEQLRRTALRGMFLQKAPEERQARPLHFSPDWQHTPPQDTQTDPVWHAWPFLGCTAGSLCKGALPGWKGQTMPRRQCHGLLCPPLPYCHLKSWQGQCLGQREDSHSIWEALNHKTRVCQLHLMYDWYFPLHP